MPNYVDYPDPVIVPSYDMIKTGRGRFPVLRLPVGKDRNGNPVDFSITIRQARAVVKHLDMVESFARSGE